MTTFTHECHEEATDEYGTPQEFVRPIADAVDGFDLDPASGAETAPIADTRYTESDDGLAQEWFGTVWLNPPFSAKAQFLEKCVAEWLDGNVDLAVVLLPVDTSTDWFHQLVAPMASVVWFRNGRLSFDGGGNSPNFGVMLAVYGDPPQALLDHLDRTGVVFRQDDRHTRTDQLSLGSFGADPSAAGGEQS